MNWRDSSENMFEAIFKLSGVFLIGLKLLGEFAHFSCLDAFFVPWRVFSEIQNSSLNIRFKNLNLHNIHLLRHFPLHDHRVIDDSEK